MTQITTILLTIVFTMCGKNCFSQKKHYPPKQIIETYIWKGACSSKTKFVKEMTLEIYNDSTYILRPIACRESYPTKKMRREQKHWVANGTYKTINGKRIYYQVVNEIGFKQYDKYVAYNDSTILKLK